jgi:hypothetical protein
MRLALALGLCSGCAAAFTTWVPDDTSDRIDFDARVPLVRLRSDTLPAHVSLADDDSVHLVLDLSAACRRIPFGHVVHVTREHVAMSTLGKIAVALGLGAIVGSMVYGNKAVDGPFDYHGSQTMGLHLTYTPGGAVAVGVGLALALAPLLVRDSVGPRSRVREDVDASSVAPLPEVEQVGVSCGDDRAALRAIGDLTAVTPWGERLHAHPDAHGEVVFSTDRYTRGTWHFAAPASNLALDWDSSAADASPR